MKMFILSILKYLILFGLFISLSIIFEQPFFLLFILIIVIFFPISFAILKNSSQEYDFFLSAKSEYVETPNNAEFKISYVRKKGLPLFNANLKFTCENRFFENNLERTLSLPISRKKNSFSFSVEENEVGLINLHISRVRMTDYTGLFCREIPLNLEAGIPVFPTTSTATTLPPITPREGTDEFTESDQSGNISSDIKEIREYHPGDRLQRIHWKLSAKLDDLFVKEMANTSTLSFVLLPELCKSEIGNTISSLSATSSKLIEEKIRFEICIFNQSICEFEYFMVSSREDFVKALTHLYCQPLYEERNAALETYKSAGKSDSSFIHIVGKKIQIGE